MDDINKPRNSVHMSKSKQHFTENVFQQQKKKIAELKRLAPKDNKDYLKTSVSLPDLKKVILFNDLSNLEQNSEWEFTLFDTEYKLDEDCPILKENNDWTQSTITSSIKGVELRNLIFRTKEYLDLEWTNVEISAHFLLRGESSFWIITRTDTQFSENSAVIRVSKDEKTQKVFASLGTFVKDAQESLVFKIFCKQQLIDYSKNKNKSYMDGDLSELRIFLVDTGEERITVKIYVNESKFENSLSSDFFLPGSERSRVLIAGSGHQCCLRTFTCSTSLKQSDLGNERNSTTLPDKKHCDCCIII